MAYAVSLQVTLNRYTKLPFHSFQLIIPGLYQSEEFRDVPTRLQLIPIVNGVVDIHLVGIEYEYGVVKKRKQITDTTRLDFEFSKDRYLFGDGYQICHIKVMGLYPVTMDLSYTKAYDLETSTDRMVLLQFRKPLCLQQMFLEIQKGIIGHLERNKKKWQHLQTDCIATQRIERYIERDIKAISKIGIPPYQVTETILYCDAFKHNQIQIQVSPTNGDTQHPTTDEIMVAYQGMVSHQFQHIIIKLKQNMIQDLECIYSLASSFLNRDQSHDRLHQVIQRTRTTIQKLVSILQSLTGPVKKHLRMDLFDAFSESIKNLNRVTRWSFGTKPIRDIYSLVIKDVMQGLYVVEQFIPIQYSMDLLQPLVIPLLALVIEHITQMKTDSSLREYMIAIQQCGLLIPIVVHDIQLSKTTIDIFEQIRLTWHSKKDNDTLLVSRKNDQWIFSLPMTNMEPQSSMIRPVAIIINRDHPQKASTAKLRFYIQSVCNLFKLHFNFDRGEMLDWLQLLVEQLHFPIQCYYLHKDPIRDFSSLDFYLMSLNHFLVTP